MRLPALVVAAMLGATLGLSACSGAPAAPASTPASAPTPEPSSAGPESASPSPVATLAAEECLSGRYTLVRFVAIGGQTYGTGQGGDVSLTFADGRYTLEGAGKEPMVVTIGGETGNLTVDGAAQGTYRRKDATATFTAGSATGGGTLDNGRGGASEKITMTQVNGVIGLAGDGQVACTAQAMTITLTTIRLELVRT